MIRESILTLIEGIVIIAALAALGIWVLPLPI